jgi:hypothetical protein
MRKMLALFMAAALAAASTAYAQGATQNAALKIVVIEGEDAVNIIQQKTAVAPLIEVRDRNNLPVGGATVTFSVTGSGATFAGGAQSITVVTNAAGQAAAAGLTPTATGAIQISATATFQGQTAIATIAQSNVLTAAQAVGTTAGAGGGAGGGTTGATTGAAAGGGGGMSATTIGIIAAAVGGGAVAATTAAGGGNDAPSATSTSSPTATSTAPPTSTTPTTPAPAPTPTPQPSSSSFAGPMDGTFTGTSAVSIPGEPTTSCNFSTRNTGTASMRLQTAANGALTGTLELNGHQVVTVSTCGELSGVLADAPFMYTANLEGSGSTVRFTQEFRDSGSVEGATYTSSATISFTGTVAGGTVTGTLTYNAVNDYRGDGFSGHATWTGNIPLTLR